jgi:excisionase family DNA binding protein
MCSESTIGNEPSYLTVAQLAQRLHFSESTSYGRVDRDYIPFLIVGDLVRFDLAAIHNWMSAQADHSLNSCVEHTYRGPGRISVRERTMNFTRKFSVVTSEIGA